MPRAGVNLDEFWGLDWSAGGRVRGAGRNLCGVAKLGCGSYHGRSASRLPPLYVQSAGKSWLEHEAGESQQPLSLPRPSLLDGIPLGFSFSESAKCWVLSAECASGSHGRDDHATGWVVGFNTTSVEAVVLPSIDCAQRGTPPTSTPCRWPEHGARGAL